MQFAVALQRDRLDTTALTRRIMVGDELLAQSARGGWTDPSTGDVRPPEPAGAAVFMDALAREYGKSLQDQAVQALEAFFQLERGNTSLVDYMSLFRMVYQEAATVSGPTINTVGQSVLLLMKSGLTP